MKGLGPSGVWVTVVAVALALGPLASPAMVLCRGEDGHLGFEAAFAGCCQEDRPASTPPTARAAAWTPEHPCGECTDVSVGQDVVPFPRVLAAAVPVAADRLRQPPPAPPGARLVAVPGAGAPSRDRDLAVVRATVLLR